MKKTLSKLSVISLVLAGCTAMAQPELVLETRNVTTQSARIPADLDFSQYLAVLKQRAPQSPLLKTYTQERDATHFPLFIDYLNYRAKQQGISDSAIKQGLSNVQFIARAVTADKNQPEKKFTLQDYLNRVLSPARYKQAKSEWQKNKTRLQQVENQSGVPANVIVALWGLESAFGKIQGKEDVISAVATLAYEGRREAFFTKEVMSALTLLDKGYISRSKMKGSWAGAMGQCQFMPSSLLKYGADGDGDGIIDIWSNPNDVFSSIANYLATVGWQQSATWGHKISVPADFDHALEGTADNKMKTVAQWKKLGVKLDAQLANQPKNNQRAWVILPDDDLKSAYLVYDNFKTLMDWNRSYYFGISVGMLADSLK